MVRLGALLEPQSSVLANLQFLVTCGRLCTKKGRKNRGLKSKNKLLLLMFLHLVAVVARRRKLQSMQNDDSRGSSDNFITSVFFVSL